MITARVGRIAVFAVAAAAVCASVAHAKGEERRLAASNAWNMHYADDGCQLLREFGTGADRILLSLERYEPTDDLRVAIAGRPLTPAKDKDHVTLRFGPDATGSRMPVTIGTIGAFEPALFGRVSLFDDASPEAIARKTERRDGAPSGRPSWAQMAEREIARARAIPWIAVDVSKSRRIVLETGSLQHPLSAMRACTDNLVQSWGLDPVEQAKLASFPVPRTNPGKWIRDDDYPSEMVRQGKQTLIQFRLMVDANGDVSSCHIQRSTRLKAFDEVTCKAFIRRAKFEPARDPAGKPVASFWNNTVLYQILP